MHSRRFSVCAAVWGWRASILTVLGMGACGGAGGAAKDASDAAVSGADADAGSDQRGAEDMGALDGAWTPDGVSGLDSVGGERLDGPAVRLPNPLFAEWPVIPVGVEARSFSSFDRRGGNDDGFNGTYSTLSRTANGEFVIVDAVGPGRLNTFWFTSGESGHARLSVGKIRVYLDDEAAPRVEADANELFSGRLAGFPRELVFDNARSTGGFVSWVPVTFRRRLRITTEQRPFFYNAHYEVLPVTSDVESWRPSQHDPAWAAMFAAADESWDEAALEELPLDHSRAGSGVIETLDFRPARPAIADELQAARIQIWWDDASAPGVDVPLGMFFGSGLGEARVRAIAFRMDPGRYQARFPMPFWKSFRIKISGLEGRLAVQIGLQRFDQRRAGHFHAVHRAARPAMGADDFEYLKFDGSGKLVGTVLTVEPPRPAIDKGWWEGDLRSYADGRRTPAIHGTGHEDDHFGGWSNEFFDQPFSLPMHGEPKTEIFDRAGQYNGNVTMYRLWPGIPFLRGIVHSVEHGHANSRAVNYASVTFFYASTTSPLEESDVLRVCDTTSRQAHDYSAGAETEPAMLRSAFEGRFSAVVHEACHAAHRGPARFRVKLAATNEGFYLRRIFDQEQGGQAAHVSVDGMPVGLWYAPERNDTFRWAERDLFVPGKFTAGRQTVEVRIEPMGNVPWDAAEYRVLSVRPR